MQLHHILKAQQFSREDLEHIFDVAGDMEQLVREGEGSVKFTNKIMATLFYEPSTRTRLSFETAMRRLGGGVISTENAREFSSAIKGETIEDTVRIVGSYADVIVIRHYESGACERAAAVSRVPIINAGDGPGQHPTQALLDLYTIQKELGRIDGLTIAMVGDLAHGRTVRSLSYLLTRFNIKKIIFVAPDVVRMRDDIKEHLTEHKISFAEEENLLHAVRHADVVYMTRIQKERFGDRIHEFEQASGKYIIDTDVMKEMKTRSIVMHPLPRVNEIEPAVDKDPRAAYFRQAENGLYIRMALLKLIFSK